MGLLEKELLKEAQKRGLQGLKPPPGGLGGLGKLGLAGVAVGVGVAGLGIAIESAIKQGQEPLKRADQPEGARTPNYESGDNTRIENFGDVGKLYNVAYSAYARTSGANTSINAGGSNSVVGPVSANLFIAKYSGLDTWFVEIRGNGQAFTGTGSNTFYYNSSHRLGNLRITPSNGQGESWQGQQISSGSSGLRTTLAPGLLPDFKPGTDKNQDKNQEDKGKKLIPGGAPNSDKQRNKDSDRQKDKNKFPQGDGSKAPELQIPPPVLAPPPASPDITLTPGKGRNTGGGSSKAPTAKAPPPAQKLPDLKGGDSSKIIDGKRLPFPDALSDPEKEPNQTPIDPCLISAPCSTSQTKTTENNLKDLIEGLFKTIDLSLLYTINTKLGDQIPGGIGPFLKGFQEAWKRFADWSKLDRMLNLLNLWANIHNAYMLSNTLTQTLFGTIDNVLNVFGNEIKDDEGNVIGVGTALSNQIDGYFKNVFGVAEWTGIKEQWKTYNRIYQGAANLLSSLRSLSDSILQALEICGSYIAQIGNGLKKYGEISDKAFGWMNPRPNFQNRFFTSLENAEQVVSNIDSIVGEVKNIQDTIDEIQEQRSDLEKNISQATGGFDASEKPEAQKVKQEEDTKKAESGSPDIKEIDIVPPES
jgi:hypothetical protein